MYIIICLREKDFKEIPIPIMSCDEDGEIGDTMALFETYEAAQEYCSENILCKSSANIIVDLDTADGIFE